MIIDYQLHLTVSGFNFCKPNSHKLYYQYKTQNLPYGHTPNISHSIFQYKNQSYELDFSFPSSCITLPKVMNFFFEINNNNNNFHLFLLNFIPELCTFNYSLSKINIGFIGINSSLIYVLIRLYLDILRPLGDSIFR